MHGLDNEIINMKVITGVKEKPAKLLLKDFLENKLTAGVNAWDH